MGRCPEVTVSCGIVRACRDRAVCTVPEGWEASLGRGTSSIYRCSDEVTCYGNDHQHGLKHTDETMLSLQGSDAGEADSDAAGVSYEIRKA